MSQAITFSLSILGGVLPALFWLWFWLHEDKKHPEPKKRIIFAFLFGMIAVIVVLPIEKLIYEMFGQKLNMNSLLAWAAAEELVKFFAAYFTALRLRDTDEPVDFLIYMVSVALGFSALENTLFLANIIDTGAIAKSIVGTNMRFLGATLLHVVSSATIGAFMALSFYKDNETKKLTLGAGIIFSIALHTLYNFFIINFSERVFFVFSVVWISIIALIFMFEKIKETEPENIS